MKYSLFLDDIRNPEDVKWVNLPTVSWVIVRDYSQFVAEIVANGLPSFISFDHDLAPSHYSDSMMLFQDPYHNQEKTGASCARWLTQYCDKNNLDIPPYEIHSMNSIGAQNIKSILESYKKSKQ